MFSISSLGGTVKIIIVFYVSQYPAAETVPGFQYLKEMSAFDNKDPIRSPLTPPPMINT